MYSILVKNRICRDINGFHCILCNEEIIDEKNALMHVESEIHTELVENIKSLKKLTIDEKDSIDLINNGIVPISNKEYKCTFCSCTIPKFMHISEHITGKKHLTRRRKVIPDAIIDSTNLVTSNHQYKEETCSNNSFDYQDDNNHESYKEETCSDSSFNHQDDSKHESYSDISSIQNNPSLYCNGCQSYLESNSAILYHRMFHLSQRRCNINDIISFCVKENIKCIYCLLCDYSVGNEDYLDKHLKDSAHQKRLFFLYSFNHGTIMNMSYMNSALYPNFPPNLDIYNLFEYYKYLHYFGSFNFNPFQAQNNHVTVQNNYYNKYTDHYQFQQNIHQNIHQNVDDFNIAAYFCFICNMKFADENLLFWHYNEFSHRFRIEAFNLILKDKNMKLLMEKQVEIENNKTMYNNTIPMGNINANINTNIAYRVCPICKVNITHDNLMIQHLESEYHKNKVQEYYTNINCESYEKVIFSCPPCRMNFFNDKTLLEHYYTYHNHNINNVIQTNNTVSANSTDVHQTTNNLYNNGTFNNNIQHYENNGNKSLNDVNYALQDLVNFNVDEKYRKKYIHSNDRHANIKNDNDNVSNTKTSRTKKLINFSPRYVKLCVETGEENIFTINSEKLRKLKLGITLTFPYESNKGCIPCGIEISNDPQYIYEHLRSEEHEKNLQEMEDNDEFFESFKDQFSDLKLAKSYMYEDSDEWVKCLACDETVKNSDERLEEHINSKLHIEKHQSWTKISDDLFNLFNNMFKNLWYYIEKFFCNICCAQFEFEVDYARHLEHPDHLKEVEKRIIRNQSLQFDCCIVCSSYWYAKSDHHKIHCSRDSHRYILKSRDFTVPEMTDLAKKILQTSIEETIDDLLTKSNAVILSNKDTEKIVLDSVETIIRTKYPQAKAHLFGSRISYICSQDSDLDIYIDCENQYEQITSQDKSQEQLSIAQECFHKYQDIWIIEEIVLHSRVPIIVLRHRATNLNCDISFINGLSVEKSKMLGYFIDAYLPCRKLILYLKKWNVLCRLSGRKGISTFAISWLVIFYLQIKGILPSVQHLIELKNESNIVAGWETGISETIPVQETELSIKDLLRGFFKYYAEFNYISDVACPFLGKVMKKSQFSDIDSLPIEMNIYKTQVKEEKVEFFRLDSPMCIQEPIDLSQNITKAVTKLHLRMFRQYCVESAATL